jgi:hypothetical protein
MPDLPRPEEPWRLYKGEAMTEYTFFVPPPPVGWWVLPGGGPSAQIKFSAQKTSLAHHQDDVVDF